MKREYFKAKPRLTSPNNDTSSAIIVVPKYLFKHKNVKLGTEYQFCIYIDNEENNNDK